MLYKYPLFIITILFLLAPNPSLNAQQTFGVNWEIPDNNQTAIDQLQEFHKMGISIIEISQQPSVKVWDQINELEFTVFADLNILFPTIHTFTAPDSLLIDSLQTEASSYLSQPSVKAVGLFKHGAIYQQEFKNAITPYINQLHSAGKVRVYFESNQTYQSDSLSLPLILYDLKVTPKNIHTFSLPEQANIIAYKFSSSERLKGYLTPFRQFLHRVPASNKIPLLIDGQWLKSALKKQPQFRSTLYSLANNPEAAFPVPNETLPDSQSSSAIPITILLMVWGSIALYYNSSPLYRRSLFRYFNGHRFFLNDIFNRHIRSSFPAFLIIIQNALLVSAAVYATVFSVFSPLGRTSLFYHFPPFLLTTFSSGPLFILFGTLISLLILAFISIIWLYISHKNIIKITQIAIIYAWPLQLNYLLATAAIVLFSAGGNATLIAILTIATLLISVFSFIMASVDNLIFLRQKKELYLILTSGVYLLLLAGILVYGFVDRSWLDVLNLSLYLK